mgnify:CR=1 FL=1
MTTVFEQVVIADFRVFREREQFAQTPGKHRIGKQAAARGRRITGDAEIFRQVESLIARLTQEEEKFTASVTITNDRPPVMTEPQRPFVVKFNQAVKKVTGTLPEPRGMFAFTDGSILAPRLSLPLVVCGPGQPNIAHQPDEYVEISQLVESTRILSQALTELLSA